MASKARLVLEDGTTYEAVSWGAPVCSAGEVVFNTGMVGYPEALTDPSYRGQILVLTYPLVGNYGVPPIVDDEYGLPLGFESEEIQVSGLVVSELSDAYSHHTADQGLNDWLKAGEIPGLSGVDTRALTKRLRERGTLLGKIEMEGQTIDFLDPNATDLVSTVCTRDISRLSETPGPIEEKVPTVLVLDCGCKANMIRSLLRRGIQVVRVPHDHYFLDMDFDGLLISSGPGDPKMCGQAIQNVSRALALGRPILGICLGNQILGLAVNADTYKLKFGHRSQNQPSLEKVDPSGVPVSRGRCFITSQNHGYAVREESLPEDWLVWFENANDRTVEGIRHVSKPFYGVQFHPEANPGPVDTAWIFDQFAEEVKKRS